MFVVLKSPMSMCVVIKSPMSGLFSAVDIFMTKPISETLEVGLQLPEAVGNAALY